MENSAISLVGSSRDNSLIACPTSSAHIWKHCQFIAETKFASWKTKIFPTELETFDETLFLRLPTLVRQYEITKY
jgi:hypothetical protein